MPVNARGDITRDAERHQDGFHRCLLQGAGIRQVSAQRQPAQEHSLALTQLVIHRGSVLAKERLFRPARSHLQTFSTRPSICCFFFVALPAERAVQAQRAASDAGAAEDDEPEQAKPSFWSRLFGKA